MPVAAPSDKRFRRVQVKPSRRRKAWLGRALLGVRIAATLACFGMGGWLLTQQVADAESLRIDRITVRGNERLSTPDALRLLEGLRGEHVLAVDLGKWQAKLMASPWVEYAALRRVLPSTVEVTIRERLPMAIARMGEQLLLVDPAGRLIDEYGPDYAQLDLPMVDGLAGPRGRALAVDESRALLAARVIAALRRQPDLYRRVSQIDVRNARDAVVLLDDDQAKLRLGDDQFAERLQAYVELAPALRERVPEIDYVDMRFDSRVYVRPGGSARPAAARR